MEYSGFEKLLERLLENESWPLRYMFKFIVPNTEGRVDQVINLLPDDGKISFRHTNDLRFVSVTCIASMPSAEHIVSITSKAASVPGVMAL